MAKLIAALLLSTTLSGCVVEGHITRLATEWCADKDRVHSIVIGVTNPTKIVCNNGDSSDVDSIQIEFIEAR